MHHPVDVTQFHDVDQASNPTALVHFMDASHTQHTTQRYKQTLLEHLALASGATVLDVGCGRGQDALDLAAAVGPSGHVSGIDSSETMLQVARERVAQAQVSIDFIHADAAQLPFADASFDGCQASRVLAHVRQPELVVAEMVRVTRPGARIVLADGDLDLIAVDIADRTLGRKVIHAACDQITQGWMGRQLHRCLQGAGMRAIRVEGRLMPLDYPSFQSAFRGLLLHAQVGGSLTEQELTRFWEALQSADQAGHFSAHVGGFIVSGQKSA